jgi:hypothetical protein
MSKLLRAAFAAACLFAVGPYPTPSHAQAPAQAQPQLDEALAFVGQLGEVTKLQVEGVQKLLDAKPLFDSMATPAGAKAAAPRLRLLMDEARATVRRADAMTGAIVPPPGLRLGTLDPAAMLGEVRSHNAKTLALLADFDAFLAAAERGDRAAMGRAAPRLMEGSLLLIDGNASMYRNRQAAIPSTQSVHQALEIGVQLYRAMSASGRAWIAAKTGGADSAAASLRAQLAQVSIRAGTASREGRANLARELADLDRRIAGAGLRGHEAAAVGRIREALAGKEKLFEVGDEVAAAAVAGGRITGAGLAAQPSPQLLGRLAPLELRFQTVLAAQAAIATGQAK